MNRQWSTNLISSGAHWKRRCGPLAHRLHAHLIKLIHSCNKEQ